MPNEKLIFVFFKKSAKVEGKTVSLYVRKGIAQKAKEMTKRHKKVRVLIQKLSKVNWEILKLDNE